MGRFFVVTLINAWFNLNYMSGDEVNYNSVSSSSSTRTSTNAKVDINHLISRARADEKKQKKENLVFFSLIKI